jgi:16S rRNA (adenine1518-N6/adenine1519-N6)-dimethyltransferase
MGARLGQHFLKNPVIAKSLVDACSIREGETVVEIGPGTGALTKELLATGGRIIAIEKDEALTAQLHTIFARDIEEGALRIVGADIREITPESIGLVGGTYVLAANIPYYITGEIMRQFLSAQAQPRVASLLIQKEVAQRITSSKESILSLSVKAYGKPRIERYVSAGNFSPPPDVDSAILVIDDISRKNFDGVQHEEMFFKIVKTGFSSKRKMLLNNLSGFGKEAVLSIFKELGISEKARAEELPLQTWLDVSRRINALAQA